jgi:hypothetical protein
MRAGEQTEILREHRLILKLADRPIGDLQVASEFAISFAAAALAYVRPD